MSLDATDAHIIRKRALNWAAHGEIGYGVLLYQMSGQPGVDPYGWRRERIDEAIKTAERLGLVSVIETLYGADVKAI